MNKAEFPQRQCREHVPYSVGVGDDAVPMVALCELAEHGDDGPCASFSVPASVARRDAWEAAQEGEDA
jgi:hypothetical protein